MHATNDSQKAMSSINPNLLTGLGCALAIFLTAAGSAIATAHGSIFAINSGNPKAFIPVVQAGVIALYGLLVSYLLLKKFNDDLTIVEGVKCLSAGLSVGLASLASGWGMSVLLRQVGTNSTRNEAPAADGGTVLNENTPLIATSALGDKEHLRKIILSMIFLELIAFYGLIVALFLIH